MWVIYLVGDTRDVIEIHVLLGLIAPLVSSGSNGCSGPVHPGLQVVLNNDQGTSHKSGYGLLILGNLCYPLLQGSQALSMSAMPYCALMCSSKFLDTIELTKFHAD